MKNLIKILTMVFISQLFIVACDDDDRTPITDAVPSFKLYDPGVSALQLFETSAGNPFTIVWDETVGGDGEYTVVFASDENFSDQVTLGTTTENSFTTTISELNTALLQAGYNPFVDSNVYFRVISDSASGGAVLYSNTISFLASTYPVDVPVVTSPSVGDYFILDGDNPDTEVTRVTASDYASYGSGSITYIVEAVRATHDFDNPDTTVVNLGSFPTSIPDQGGVGNIEVDYLPLTMLDLNKAAIEVGIPAEEVGGLDIRVKAVSTSTGGEITKASEPVRINVKTYELAIPNLYLVGDATAASWDNSATNLKMFPLLRNTTSPKVYTFTGKFNAGGFKLIVNKGSWDDQYGSGGEGVLLYNDGSSGNINVATAGYYTLTVDTGNLTYTLVPYTGSTATTYSTIGVIGDATPGVWVTDTDMTQSTFDPHIWYIGNIALTANSAKFRADNDWSVNWGSPAPLFGTGTMGGDNIPVEEAGNYDIHFNDLTGDYNFVLK
ncbi:MAG: SusF/SusE family outer membrane protein [Flavobacteriales bacterium]|nr:SusF/SusE family outer membrane protein [Flavobacteriales bacterium]